MCLLCCALFLFFLVAALHCIAAPTDDVGLLLPRCSILTLGGGTIRLYEYAAAVVVIPGTRAYSSIRLRIPYMPGTAGSSYYSSINI